MSKSPTHDSLITTAASLAYWASIPADENGMLGGFASISRVDLQGSRSFLAKLGLRAAASFPKRGAGTVDGGNGSGSGSVEMERGKEERSLRRAGEMPRKIARAVDCGAGIGRVTEGVLLSIAETVDILEPIARFSDNIKGKEGVGRIWNVGLEQWDFDGDDLHETMKYDLIWNQWCLGHLTDTQLVEYLVKCSKALKEGGFIVIKENLSTGEDDNFDEVDSSVTRKDEKFRDIFRKASLKVRRTELQKGLLKGLYPVRMYALQPMSR